MNNINNNYNNMNMQNNFRIKYWKLIRITLCTLGAIGILFALWFIVGIKPVMNIGRLIVVSTHLNLKYIGEDFDYIRFESGFNAPSDFINKFEGGYSNSTKILYKYPKADKYYVKATYLWDDKELYDTFLPVKYEEQTSEYRKSLYKKWFTGLNAYEQIDSEDFLETSEFHNMSFAEFLHKYPKRISVYVECDLDEINREEIQKDIIETIQNKRLYFRDINIYFYDKIDLQLIEKEGYYLHNLDDISDRSLRLLLEFDENYNITNIDWLKCYRNSKNKIVFNWTEKDELVEYNQQLKAM